MRERRTGPPRLGAAVAAMVMVLGVTGFLPGSAPSADGGSGRLVLEGRASLTTGVAHLRYSTSQPLNVIHVARIKAGSNVTLRPVLSNNRVVGDSSTPGLEITSSMCRRAGAVACVNGDFTACSGCSAPLGGVIRNGEVLRTPNPSWPQLWVGPGGVGAGQLRWLGRVRATYQWTEQIQEGATDVTVPVVPATKPRAKSLVLELSGVNVPRSSGGLVLYTPAYASRTHTPPGGTEVVVTSDGRAALHRKVNLTVGAIGTNGNAAIPRNGFVLSATGAAADRLRAFWLEARRYPERLTSLTLGMVTSTRVTQSLGGHPVILRNGQPLAPPAPSDTASRVRHPRTVVGWNAAGDVWLVTIDGRQPGRSVGATYWEAADVLRQLGASDGINLDGGGSTTFVAKRCAGRLCVRNRPSDGRERAVTTGLAIVPRR